MIEMGGDEKAIMALFTQFNVGKQQTTTNEDAYDFDAFFQQYFKAIQLGNRDNENYNFFTFDKRYIRIEPIYLEKIVANDYEIHQVRGDVERYFPSQAERIEKGYFVKTYSWNKELHKVNDYEEVAKVWEAMQYAGVKGDVISYSTLINKSPNFETALSFLKEMKSLNLKPNEISYNTLINKSPNFETALSFLKEMKSLNLKPNIITYNTLLNKCKRQRFSPKTEQFEQAILLLEDMMSLRLRPQYKGYKRYTLTAVVGIMRRHQAAFRAWYLEQYSLRKVWWEFFRSVAEQL